MSATETQPLLTGWGPDVPAGDTVVRQYVACTAHRVGHLAHTMGKPWSADDDVVMADMGLQEVLLNNAVLLQPLPSDDVLDRIEAFFPAGRIYTVISAWPTLDLRPRGFHLIGHPPLMVRPVADEPAAPVPPPGLRIEEVHDAEGLATFERTAIEAYPLDRLAGIGPNEAFGAGVLDGGSVRIFVGWVDGRPVATAGAISHAGITQVEYVSTLPDARGRGIGAAITWAATVAWPDQPAVLISSDDGRPVYERIGYFPITRFTLWFREAGG